MKESLKNIAILRPILRGIPVIIAVLTVSVWLVSRYLRYTTPVYESTAKLKLADVNEGTSSANLFKDFDVFANTNKIGAEVEVLKSTYLVAKALDSLHFGTTLYRLGKLRKTELYKNAPFDVIIDESSYQYYGQPITVQIKNSDSFRVQLPGKHVLKGHFNEALTGPGVTMVINKNYDFLKDKSSYHFIDNYEFVIHKKEQLIAAVISKLDITPVDKDVPIIRISYQSPVPEKAADLVNILSNAYIEDYISSKYKAANTTVKFLQGQLTEIGGKLTASETAIESYRDQKQITNIRQETETDLRKIAQLKIQLANLKMNLSAIDTLDAYISNGKHKFLELAPNFEAFTDLLSTEIIKKIKQLQDERLDLLEKFTEQDEKVVALDEKIENLSQYMQESIHNTRKNYEIKYREIEKVVDDAEKIFIGLPGKEKTMGILERSFGLNEKMYNFLHEKQTEAEIARAATISFHRIIEHGEIPTKPISPNKPLLTGLAVMLGLFISVTGILLVHTMKAKVNDAHTIEKHAATPIIAEVPRLVNSNERSRYFTDLATQLELKKLFSGKHVITISSFSQGEGKSFIAENLSSALRMAGKNTVLVDATKNDKPRNQLGILLLDNLQEELNILRKEYDIIVLKNLSFQNGSEALQNACVADINLFVLDARKTPANKIIQAELLKQEYSFNNMHYILNNAGYNPSLLRYLFSKLKKSIELFYRKTS